MEYGSGEGLSDARSSQAQRTRTVSWAFRIALFLSFLAKIAIFSTIPFHTASIYIGLGLIIFDISLVVLLRCYIKKVETETIAQPCDHRTFMASHTVNPSAMLPPPYEESVMNVYNISGQHQQHQQQQHQQQGYPASQHNPSNMFSEMGPADSANFILMGPVIANRAYPPPATNEDFTLEEPPSYEDAIKQIS